MQLAGHVADKKLIPNDPQAIEIVARIGLLAASLFGGHVERGAAASKERHLFVSGELSEE